MQTEQLILTVVKTKYPSFNQIIPWLKTNNFLIRAKILEHNPILANSPYLVVEITPIDAIMIIDYARIPGSIVDLAPFKEVLDDFCEIYSKKYLIVEDYFLTGQNYAKEFKLILKGLFLLAQVDHHLPIFPIQTIEGSLLILTSLAKRLQVVDNPPAIGREKPKRTTISEAQQYLIEGLHNTGSKKAKRLLHKFGNPTQVFDQIFWMEKAC